MALVVFLDMVVYGPCGYSTPKSKPAGSLGVIWVPKLSIFSDEFSGNPISCKYFKNSHLYVNAT